MFANDRPRAKLGYDTNQIVSNKKEYLLVEGGSLMKNTKVPSRWKPYQARRGIAQELLQRQQVKAKQVYYRQRGGTCLKRLKNKFDGESENKIDNNKKKKKKK